MSISEHLFPISQDRQGVHKVHGERRFERRRMTSKKFQRRWTIVVVVDEEEDEEQRSTGQWIDRRRSAKERFDSLVIDQFDQSIEEPFRSDRWRRKEFREEFTQRLEMVVGEKRRNDRRENLFQSVEDLRRRWSTLFPEGDVVSIHSRPLTFLEATVRTGISIVDGDRTSNRRTRTTRNRRRRREIRATKEGFASLTRQNTEMNARCSIRTD